MTESETLTGCVCVCVCVRFRARGCAFVCPPSHHRRPHGVSFTAIVQRLYREGLPPSEHSSPSLPLLTAPILRLSVYHILSDLSEVAPQVD